MSVHSAAPMFSGAPLHDVLTARPELLASVTELRERTRESMPGRTAELVDARIRRLLLDETSDHAAGPHEAHALSPAEQVVVDLAEQFLVDAHGIDEAMTERLREHWPPADIVTFMFHIGLMDGFTRLERVAVPAVESHGTVPDRSGGR